MISILFMPRSMTLKSSLVRVTWVVLIRVLKRIYMTRKELKMKIIEIKSLI